MRENWIWEKIPEDLCGVKARIELENPARTEYNDAVIHQAKPGAIWFSDKWGSKRFYSGNYLVEIAAEVKQSGVLVFKEEEHETRDSMDTEETFARSSQN